MSTVTRPLPVPVHRTTRWRLPADITALARVEGRRLVLHPVFFVGVLLSVVLVVAASTSDEGQLHSGLLSGFALLPLAAGTVIAANLGALRSRRDDTDELYASLPRPRSSRAAGQLLGLAWTLPISGVLLATTYFAFGAQHGLVVNYVGLRHTPALVELAQGPLVVIALGAIGILLARIAPSLILVPLLVVVGFFAGYPLAFSDGQAWVHWLAPLSNDEISRPGAWVPCKPGDPMPVGENASGCNLVLRYDLAGMAWHVTYLSALMLLAGAASVVRTRRRIAALISLIPVLAIATALAAG